MDRLSVNTILISYRRVLPGEGNLLVFDNGGQGGYGFANPARPDGTNSMTRDMLAVLGVNPITLEVLSGNIRWVALNDIVSIALM